MLPKSKKTSWEPVAKWYDELLSRDDTYQTQVILPNLVRLVAPKGKSVIDIACGQGFFSKAFTDLGATVAGFDIAPELIRRAKENESKNLKFAVAPATDMPAAKNDSYDVATIVLAIQNIEDMKGTFKEAARVLKKGGTLIIVLNHPTFRIPRASAWGYDENENIQYRRIDHYGVPFKVSIDMTPGAKKEQEKVHTVSFHRPLQEYVKALANTGFVVAGLEEWVSHKKSEKGPRAAAEDAARKEFPLFLTLIARKN